MQTQNNIIRSMRVLRGPNLYARIPVLHAVIDAGDYEERPSISFPGFTERLTAWLPGLQQHECNLHKPGGFVQRLREGTYLAHICEHVALELQNGMGFDVSFGRAFNADERGVYNVIVAYKEEYPARTAFETTLRLVLAAMHDEPFDVAHELDQLLLIADHYRLGPSTGAIVEAARRRNIPVLRLTETSSLVQLGYGINQKRIMASETSQTSAIAVELCHEKPLTNDILRRVGVPVPDGRQVATMDEAWQAAQNIGLPVVVKPEDGNQGKGVSVNLTTEAEVHKAFEIASGYSQVMVEKYIEGHDYRLLVVNGHMVAASRRDPAAVVGDGEHTIEQLVELANRDPRRRPGHSSSLTKILLNDAAQLVLSQQSMVETSVPGAGQVVRLRNNANLSTGGSATDVTDDVHPGNAQLAQLAAQILALDVAGIDILARDIRRPLAEQNGAIVEVNAAPGLRMHLLPAHGTPRDVGKPIIEMLYPGSTPARIPIIAITGTNGKTTVTRLISHMYETAHKRVGMTCTNGTYINQERILTGDCSGPTSAQAVLLHPHVEVAVLETARGGILRAGLAFDECKIGVVTNISPDHIGLRGVNSVEDLAKVKQVVVEAVAADGAAILNADDPLVAEMAAATHAEIVYFSMNPHRNLVLTAHAAAGGRYVCVEDEQIMLMTGESRTMLIELDRVGFTYGGKLHFQVLNALAAAAAAWAEGLNPAMIARALTTFVTDSATVPGRFNISEVHGRQVVIDYGHNVGAIQALSQALQALPARNTVLVMCLAGDRRNDDIQATMKATLPFADRYILFDAEDRRGRAPMELPTVMSAVLPSEKPHGFAANQEQAVYQAWAQAQPGERIVIIADIVEQTIALLHKLSEASTLDAVCDTPVGGASNSTLSSAVGSILVNHGGH